jgi:transcription antitermination factor NusG
METAFAERPYLSEIVECTPAGVTRWHALWTRSHCEKLVHDQLVSKGLHPFLPVLREPCKGPKHRPSAGTPLFPGYLFLHEAMDKANYIEVRKTRGLVAILGERWDRLAVIPDDEVGAIQRMIESRLPLAAHPYLREGERVRVARGPLAGIEGILIQVHPKKTRLVVSIDLLQRSVAAEVDCAAVVPA